MDYANLNREVDLPRTPSLEAQMNKPLTVD